MLFLQHLKCHLSIAALYDIFHRDSTSLNHHANSLPDHFFIFYDQHGFHDRTKSRTSGRTRICCTRYGNVMCSRGSVIPLWIDQIRNGQPITVTEPTMTRFIMSLEEAVDLVLFAFEHGQNGDLFIQKAPACTIQTQAEAVCELFGGKKEDIRVIGIRHGEKLYETLLTNEECAKAARISSPQQI